MSVPLRCPFCVYSTSRPTALECHLKTHCKPEYRCRICQSVWADQAELEGHARAHRLGNHYRCEQCGYLSKTANKLIEHVRVHTGERPFRCDRCSYSCKRKDNLNLHKRLKHAPRQSYSCSLCPFTTTHPFVFSRHLKKHQGGGGGEGSAEEGEAQQGSSCLGMGMGFGMGMGMGLGVGREALLLLEEEEAGVGVGGISSGSGGSNSSSPLMSLTASQALQSVALSIRCKQQQQRQGQGQGQGSLPLQHYLSANGLAAPAPQPPALASPWSPRAGSLASSYYEQYRNCELAHLIPLTTLFTMRRFAPHALPSSPPLFLSLLSSSP